MTSRHFYFDFDLSTTEDWCLQEFQRQVQEGKTITEVATSFCAYKGFLRCLQYLRSIRCPWEQDLTCYYAVLRNNIDCLKFALDNGCPSNHLVSAYAAKSGQVDALQLCRDTWDKQTTAAAALWGQFHCLQYAVQHHCPYEIDDILHQLDIQHAIIHYEQDQVWLREWLLPHHIPQMPDKLRAVSMQKVEELTLQKQYAFHLCTNSLPADVIQYIICEYI